jgi:DnaJ-class molecular chaperone
MKAKLKEAVAEVKCPACNGTGFPAVAQLKPWRKIYPAPCKECAGKGRIAIA